MKKVNKRKITLLILLIVVIIEIIAFGLSRAEIIKEINVSIIDHDNLLALDECILSALDDGESGYYITLPNFLNGKAINTYYITKKTIIDDEVLSEIEEKTAGDRVYLTEDETLNQILELNVAYDNKEVENEILYNRELIWEEENNKVVVTGYMPETATISVIPFDILEVSNVIENEMSQNETVKNTYGIKILVNNIEYNNSEDDIQVRISGINRQYSYRLLRLKEEIDDVGAVYDVVLQEENIEEIVEKDESIKLPEMIEITNIESFEFQNNDIIFSDEDLNIYVLLEDDTVMEEPEMEMQTITPMAAPISGIGLFSLIEGNGAGIPWDGSVATSYASGNGSAGTPYLISNGAELAYLRQQVNSGTMHQGVYFQLASDINLGGLEWTPIGTYNNSFRGIFDGAGHTISNIQVTLATTAPANNTRGVYGIFGTIGGNTTNNGVYAEVKNLEIVNMTISVTTAVTLANTANTGISIGFVTGTMYRNSRITNVIVRSSSINGTSTITKSNANALLFVGGIAGSALNVSGTIDADPNAGNRYAIENCFVSANITVTTSAVSKANQAFYNVGGIIGHIRKQQVWPTNCLYTGTVTAATAMVGPIFGSVRGSTTGTSNANINTLWEGNDAGALTTSTLYHTAYVVNGGSAFTSSNTSGSPATNTTYRKNATASNVAHVQGVNKGTYTTALGTTILNMFNNYASPIKWKYENGTFSFRHRHHVTADLNPTETLVTLNIQDEYAPGTYTYNWYQNDVLQANNGNTISLPLIKPQDINFKIITHDGSYYGVTRFMVEKTYAGIKIAREGNVLSTVIVGSSTVAQIGDYQFSWYRRPAGGGTWQLIGGTNGSTLSGITDEYDYRVVAAHTIYVGFNVEQIYDSVVVNDLEMDLNYYTGQNYVSATGAVLPPGTNQDIYNSSNLVKVCINYSGTGISEQRVHRGTVSLTEIESEFIYYKYYPVIGGTVKIELIDNPFTNRPTGKGFNNWVPNGSVGTISYDSALHKRYIEVSVSYAGGIPQDINLSLHASWVDAAVSEKTGSNAWADVFALLNTGGARPLTTSPAYAGQSMAGFYVSAGGGNYRLIQNYDGDRIYNSSTTYYYMVTRDTNIVYLTGNISNTWAAAQSKPFTFTGLYGGVNYAPTWTTTSTNIQIYNDTVIENLRMTCGQANANATPLANTARFIYANFHNVKMGRGIIKANGTTNKNLIGIVASSGTAATGSASNITKYNLIVESGFYDTLTLANVSGTSRMFINAVGIYGCDYDRVKNDNSKLEVNYVACGAWGGNLMTVEDTNTNDVAIHTITKSGGFGTGKSDYTTGIYIGGRNAGVHYARRTAKIEGGWVYNLIGGPMSDTGRDNVNDIFIYITGGTVDLVIAGAGQTATYGNKLVSVTGGTVNYSVFGGSNGYNVTTGGTVVGSSLIYIGGNATIGNPTYVALPTSNALSNMWGAESGSVFGIGNGRSGTSYVAIGSNDHSNIIIDGNAHILRNVYGGGNYGATGISSTKTTNTTNIQVLNGRIEGDVYGGGNRNGAGNATKIATVNVKMTGGNVNNIYGGSNEQGTIHGTANVEVLGGTVRANVYGGGRGGVSRSR